MKQRLLKYLHAAVLAVLVAMLTPGAAAQDNDRILNRPYADNKRLHFGFSVGMNFQDLKLTNNAFITEDGEQWMAEVPNHSPGFCVNVLADLRLGKHFNLRLTPGMYFGNKVVYFQNQLAPADALEPSHVHQTQNIKSTYVVVPLDLKISSLRYRNLRPYFTVGGMGLFSVGKERSEQLKISRTDFMLTVGMGCDIYLPYFKLCPEVKFCFGLKNVLNKNRPDLEDNPEMMRFTESLDKVLNSMVVVTFYFE